MIQIRKASECETDGLLMRAMEKSGVGAIVAEIIEHVRADGDKALFEYADRFDHVSLTALETDRAELSAAKGRISGELLSAMTLARASRSRWMRFCASSCFIWASMMLMPMMMRLRSVCIRVTFMLTYTGTPVSTSR